MKKVLPILLFVIVALVSLGRVSAWASSPETHQHEVEALDEQISTVMKLTAGATAASAALSLLPDDTCTPIAEELAEFAKYFLIVLSALYLEKFLLTITGSLAFTVLIPVACAMLVIALFWKKEVFQPLAIKVAAAALLIYALVPTSVRVSDAIYANYAASIEQTLQETDDIVIEGEQQDEAGIVEHLKMLISNAADTAAEFVSEKVTHYTHALAIMLVTACAIPLLVLIFFAWIIKMIFGIPIPMTVLHRGARMP